MPDKLTFAARASVNATEERLIKTWRSECGRVKVAHIKSNLDGADYWLAIHCVSTNADEKGEHPIHLPGRRWHTFRTRSAAEDACRQHLRLGQAQSQPADVPRRAGRALVARTAAKQAGWSGRGPVPRAIKEKLASTKAAATASNGHAGYSVAAKGKKRSRGRPGRTPEQVAADAKLRADFVATSCGNIAEFARRRGMNPEDVKAAFKRVRIDGVRRRTK